MPSSRRRRSFGIALKVDLIIVAVLSLGMGTVFSVFVAGLVSTRNSLTEAGLLGRADVMYESIKNFMLPGEAPIAVKFLADLEAQRPGDNIELWRRFGVPAFSDNETIRTVNANLKKARFELRPEPPTPPPIQAPPHFELAVANPPSDVSYREEAGGRVYFRVYRPLINLPKCTVCHGSDHTIRGVIDLRTDITDNVRTERLTIAAAGGGFLLVVSLLALLLGAFVRRVVILPVKAIGALCGEVARGRFEGRVQLSSRDEIGELAATVNGMVTGLRERSELTKYVSSETLGALRESQEPRRVVRTVLFSDVRGFTAYSSDRAPEQVVEVLNRILEIQTLVIKEEGGDIDKFVADEVVAVFAGDDGARRACRAALAIRRRMEADPREFDGLRLGIGIATGSVIQGMIGSLHRADFTVIGDSANMGSRLCGLAKAGEILVADAARRLCPDLRFRGPIEAKVKGKDEAQRVWYLEEEGA